MGSVASNHPLLWGVIYGIGLATSEIYKWTTRSSSAQLEGEVAKVQQVGNTLTLYQNVMVNVAGPLAIANALQTGLGLLRTTVVDLTPRTVPDVAQMVAPVMNRENQLVRYTTQTVGTAAVGEGLFSNMHTTTQEACGYAWANLSWAAQMGFGVAGAAGIAYLTYKYWKNSGTNMINTNNNVVNIHLEPKPGMRVIKEEKEGKVTFTFEANFQEDKLVTVQELLKKTRAQEIASNLTGHDTM